MKISVLALLIFIVTLLLLLVSTPVAAQAGLANVSDDEITAYRWTAMGQFYADAGLLNWREADYQEATDCQADRWQAMAKYYADHGMLTDDPDAVMAARWLAMAQFYQDHDMLVWQKADYDEAAECQEIRWLAMAKYYADHGLLTREPSGT